jgi:hypothetical protein
MSHAEGAYLGGIRTVEDLRQRCRVDEDTGCWHWGLAMVQGHPKVHFVMDGVRTSTRGRRASLLLAGKVILKGHVVFPVRKCHADDCMNPDHARSGSRANHGQYLKASGRAKTPAKQAAARMVSKTFRATINEEKAQAIRESTKSTYELAREYGIAQSAIWSIKAGRAWKPCVPASSVFAWANGGAP